MRILISFSLLLSSLAMANEDIRCRLDDDPYAVPAYVDARVPVPVDVGKCVAQDQFRPVLSLSEEDNKLFSEHPGRRVANIRTVDGWYMGSVPTHAVREMYFLVNIRHMPVLGKRGGHSEVRVFFDEPVYLIKQYGGHDIRLADELIFTANPVGSTEQDRHNTLKNFDGSLLQARGVQTRESRLKQSFIDSFTYTVHQYKLNLTKQEIAEYIDEWVTRSDRKRLKQHFYLTHTNCDSTQFEVLDYVLRHRYWFPLRPFDPHFAKQRLLERKLIDVEVQRFESEPWAQEMLQQPYFLYQY